MGQKVHPIAIRLGVPYVPTGSYIFRNQAAAKTLPASAFSFEPTPSVNFLSPTHADSSQEFIKASEPVIPTHSFINDDTMTPADKIVFAPAYNPDPEYGDIHKNAWSTWNIRMPKGSKHDTGAQLNFLHGRLNAIENVFLRSLLHSNRSLVEWTEECRLITIDFTSLQNPILTDVQRYSLKEMLEAVVRTFESRYTKFYNGVPIVINLKDMYNHSIDMSDERDKRYEDTNNAFKMKMEPKRVTSEGRVFAFIMNTVFQSANRTAKAVCMLLEDSPKHMDVISDLRNRMDILADDLRFGFLHHKDDVGSFQGAYRGYRIQVKGTIDGSRRTRTEIIDGGMTPTSTFSAPASISYRVANTTSGSRGVKVMFFY